MQRTLLSMTMIFVALAAPAQTTQQPFVNVITVTISGSVVLEPAQ